MNSKKNILIFFILISVLSSFLFSSAVSFADDRSYTIPWANINLTMGDDGTLHVKEVIHYHFFGTYNGVYRDIPLKVVKQLKIYR